MKYLLDTNVLSEIRKGGRCDRHVASWFDAVADEDLGTSVLVLGEIRKGVERLRARDPAHARILEFWLDGLPLLFRDRILSVGAEAADLWGRISARLTLPVTDALLAATAIVHGLTLVTRNVRHVSQTGASWLNPFEPR